MTLRIFFGQYCRAQWWNTSCRFLIGPPGLTQNHDRPAVPAEPAKFTISIM